MVESGVEFGSLLCKQSYTPTPPPVKRFEGEADKNADQTDESAPQPFQKKRYPFLAQYDFRIEGQV